MIYYSSLYFVWYFKWNLFKNDNFFWNQISDRLVARWIRTQQRWYETDPKVSGINMHMIIHICHKFEIFQGRKCPSKINLWHVQKNFTHYQLQNLVWLDGFTKFPFMYYTQSHNRDFATPTTFKNRFLNPRPIPYTYKICQCHLEVVANICFCLARHNVFMIFSSLFFSGFITCL